MSSRRPPSRAPSRSVPARERPYHHGDLRRALIATAHELVAAGAGPSLSLRALAREAGVSPAAPYHHFTDRPHVLAAVAADAFRQLMAAQDADLRGRSEPAERLAVMCQVYLRFAVEHGPHYALMFSAEYMPSEGFPDYHQAAGEAFARLMVAVCAVAQLDPERDAPDAVERTLAVWAAVHGLARLYVDRIMEAPQFPSLTAMLARIGPTCVAIARTPGG
jgi:AcrR family transcriptional regulator